MKTYNFDDILTLVHLYGIDQRLVGKQLSVGIKQAGNAFSPEETYGALILIEQEGYRIMSEIGKAPQEWGTNTHLRIAGENDKGALLFEVSPEGHLRFIGAEDPEEVNLFTFRHNQELLESSVLALTLLQEFTEQAEEFQVAHFAVELRGIVSQTFFFTKEGENPLYLADDDDALPAMTQAILDSFFENVVIHVSGFNSPEERVFEREWVVEKGMARDESGKVVEVEEEVTAALQKAAESQGQVIRSRMNPSLSDDERRILDAVFDASLEEMSLLTLINTETGPVAETFVDSVKGSDGKSHLFVDSPDVLTRMAQTKAVDMVILVSRLVNGETVTRVFATDDLRELTEDELNQM